MLIDIDSWLADYPVLKTCREDVLRAYQRMVGVLESGNHIYVCGNGGSAADADHITTELLKGFRLPRPLGTELRARLVADHAEMGVYLSGKLQQGLRVSSLASNAAFITAMANDVGAELIFAQQVMALGSRGDLFLGITTSGNSANICHAVRVARSKGMVTIGLTGKTGGAIVGLCDECIRVPETETYRVQELHLPVYHFLSSALEDHFFKHHNGE